MRTCCICNKTSYFGMCSTTNNEDYCNLCYSIGRENYWKLLEKKKAIATIKLFEQLKNDTNLVYMTLAELLIRKMSNDDIFNLIKDDEVEN